MPPGYGIYGFRGYLALSLNQQSAEVEQFGSAEKLVRSPLRCYGAGKEDYPNGMPRRYWSELGVIEGDQKVLRREIAVNDPLVYKGIRFLQSGYGATGKLLQARVEIESRVDPISVLREE